MRYAFLLILLAAGCSTPEHHTYERGTFVRPPPAPVFTPIQDAPHTTGQPGHLAPVGIPRSPHSRVLPPTKEPGLWSGDQPRAGPDQKPRDPKRPLPGTTTAQLAASTACAQEVHQVQQKVFREAFKVLTFDERRCLNFKMAHLCAETEERAARKFPDLAHHESRWKNRAGLDTAEEFAFAVRWYCDKVESDRLLRYFEAGHKEFYAVTRIPR